MFLAHSIRLRDPWQCAAAAEQGGVCWSRRFHRPTGLEADDQLLLVVSGLPVGAVVRVNGCPFSDKRSAISDQQEASESRAVAQQFDLTSILADANEIEIDIPHDPLQPLVEPRQGNSFPYDARLAVMGNS